jgi:hypothetical protein
MKNSEEFDVLTRADRGRTFSPNLVQGDTRGPRYQ